MNSKVTQVNQNYMHSRITYEIQQGVFTLKLFMHILGIRHCLRLEGGAGGVSFTILLVIFIQVLKLDVKCPDHKAVSTQVQRSATNRQPTI